MKRVLFAIGCDSYQHLDQLTGAENDATQVQAALVGANAAAYETTFLLRSPTFSELRDQLSQLSTAGEKIDVFTFFFAGHGTVKTGSFWMCLRDTHLSKVSTTAYSLSNLLQLVQELNPKHANVVIDACESGGVLGDIRSALRANDFGDAGSTGISLLAACAKDQYAGELDGAGICTSVMLRCVNGAIFVQDFSPDLDLADIAKKVSRAGISDQNPVFWGLNLSIAAPFCSNPHYSNEGTLREAIAAPSETKNASRIKNAIWQSYVELEDRWDCRSFSKRLIELLDLQALDVWARLTLLAQISTAFTLQASGSTDSFREIEVHATCLVSLLPYCEDPLVSEYVLQESALISEKVLNRLTAIVESLESDEYALLGRSAVPELFFLPVRITKLAGWIGAALHIAESHGRPIDRERVQKLFDSIFDKYALSCSSMSEQQAPYAISAITALAKLGFRDCAEMYCSSLFKSLCDVRGNIASPSISSRETIAYLFARAFNDFSDSDGLIARPSELAMVLLLCATILDLGDIFDESLIDLDRTSINAFIPASYKHYGRERIDSGRNYTFKIGFDIWTVADLKTYWIPLPRPAPENVAIGHLSVISSLLYPDRVCWHLLDGLSA